MERTGLVARIEEDLERIISLGKLPRNGFLPSEQVLAKNYGVSRATAREALLRLTVRGLVVQHPGRRSRAVPLDEAVTLENLSMALHAEGPAHPERRRLLEGFFDLKRETTVELLAACCEHASEASLNQLINLCFSLEQTGPWEQASTWAKREFELLRQAALAVNRPGHFLLVQSLERSFWSMAERVLPRLDFAAIRRWALCAFHALGERNTQTMKRELPVLLLAGDKQLFVDDSSPRDEATVPLTQAERGSEATSLPTLSEVPDTVDPLLSGCQTRSLEGPPHEAPIEAARGALGEAIVPTRSGCQTGSCQASTEGALPSEAMPSPLSDGDRTDVAACQTGACPTPAVSCSERGVRADSPDASLRRAAPETSVAACHGWAWRALTWSPVPWSRAARGAPSACPSTHALPVFA